jgi:uncharacterized linocin/CFP29 family protein
MRPILDSTAHQERKKRKLAKLVERYYGKLAVLQAWEQTNKPDTDYIRDLKARLRTHKNDLIYRGHDDAGDLPV